MRIIALLVLLSSLVMGCTGPGEVCDNPNCTCIDCPGDSCTCE